MKASKFSFKFSKPKSKIPPACFRSARISPRTRPNGFYPSSAPFSVKIKSNGYGLWLVETILLSYHRYLTSRYTICRVSHMRINQKIRFMEWKVFPLSSLFYIYFGFISNFICCFQKAVSVKKGLPPLDYRCLMIWNLYMMVLYHVLVYKVINWDQHKKHIKYSSKVHI